MGSRLFRACPAVNINESGPCVEVDPIELKGKDAIITITK